MAINDAEVCFDGKGEWKKRKKDVQRIIKRLIESTKKPKNVRRSVVGAKHGWSMTLQDQLDFHVLNVWSNNFVNQNDAMASISKMIDASAFSVDAFEKTYLELVSTYHSRDIKFTVMYPFHITLQDDSLLPLSFKLPGLKIYLRNKTSVLKQIGRKRFDDTIRKSVIPSDIEMPEYFLTATENGKGPIAVCRSLSEGVHFFRGYVELYLGLFSLNQSFPYKPPANIPNLGWGLTFNVSEKDLQTFIEPDAPFYLRNRTSYVCRKKNITEKHLNGILRNLTNLDQKLPSDTQKLPSLIVDVMRIYCSALDANTETECFLALWRCAERVVAASPKDSNQAVISRLAIAANLINKFDVTGFDSVLRNFSNIRNQIVHQGIGEVSHEETSFLKIFVDFGISLLINNLDILKSDEDIRFFYSYITANDNRIDSVRSTINRHEKILDRLEERFRKSRSS